MKQMGKVGFIYVIWMVIICSIRCQDTVSYSYCKLQDDKNTYNVVVGPKNNHNPAELLSITDRVKQLENNYTAKIHELLINVVKLQTQTLGLEELKTKTSMIERIIQEQGDNFTMVTEHLHSRLTGQENTFSQNLTSLKNELQNEVKDKLSQQIQNVNSSMTNLSQSLTTQIQTLQNDTQTQITHMSTAINAVKEQLENETYAIYDQISELQNLVNATRESMESVDLKIGLLWNQSRIVFDCPSGFIKHKELSSCYKFVARDLTWFDAQQLCKIHNAHLVAVESDIEQSYLKSHIQTAQGLMGHHFWTSGTDLAVEDEWVWAHNNMPVGYTNWLVGQPDDQNGEHCLILGFEANYAWKDKQCMLAAYSICEHLLP